MLEQTGFMAREEGDEFLVLTCPECSTRIVFTQRVDLLAIRVATDTHTNRCPGKVHSLRPGVAEVAAAGR